MRGIMFSIVYSLLRIYLLFNTKGTQFEEVPPCSDEIKKYCLITYNGDFVEPV